MDVDHLVYAGPDLEAATARVEEHLGVRSTPGGPHPGRGTRNALIALGPSSYLEIIGPDLEQPPPALPRPFGIDGLRDSKLVTWAAQEPDLAGRVRSAAANGVTLGALAEGSRRRPDGLLLQWNYTDPRTVIADGLAPFFINWGATPHPSTSLGIALSNVEGHPAASAAPRLRSGRAELPSKGGGVALAGLRAEHPDPDRIRDIFSGLGLMMDVSRGPAPSLIATIDGPRGRVELR